MTMHADGPWKVSLTDDTVVLDATGREVAAIDGDYNDPDTWQIMEANARVIAAAPEMLAALKEAARCVYALENILRAKAKNDPEGRRELGECCAAYALIDAALAKAEGRAA